MSFISGTKRIKSEFTHGKFKFRHVGDTSEQQPAEFATASAKSSVVEHPSSSKSAEQKIKCEALRVFDTKYIDHRVAQTDGLFANESRQYGRA